MALIKCPECDVDVSEHAIACPKCAFPVSETNPQNNNGSITPLTKKELKAQEKEFRKRGRALTMKNVFRFALIMSILAFLVTIPASCISGSSIFDTVYLIFVGLVFAGAFILGLIILGFTRVFEFILDA